MSKKQYNEEDFSGISDMLEGKHHVIPIVSNEDEEEAENTEVPDTLPILTLRSSVLFPGSMLGVDADHRGAPALDEADPRRGSRRRPDGRRIAEGARSGAARPGRPVPCRHRRAYPQDPRDAQRQPDGDPARPREGRDQGVPHRGASPR